MVAVTTCLTHPPETFCARDNLRQLRGRCCPPTWPCPAPARSCGGTDPPLHHPSAAPARGKPKRGTRGGDPDLSVTRLRPGSAWLQTRGQCPRLLLLPPCSPRALQGTGDSPRRGRGATSWPAAPQRHGPGRSIPACLMARRGGGRGRGQKLAWEMPRDRGQPAEPPPCPSHGARCPAGVFAGRFAGEAPLCLL